jgi:hypothetical protein
MGPGFVMSRPGQNLPVFAVKSASFRFAFIAKITAILYVQYAVVQSELNCAVGECRSCHSQSRIGSETQALMTLLKFDMAPSQHGLTMNTMTVGFHYKQSINFDLYKF